MEEHIFYEEEGIKITSVLLYQDEDTYVLSEISSIKKEYGKKEVPSFKLKLSTVLIGIGFLLTVFNREFDNIFYLIGGIILAIALLEWILQDVEHSLTITFSSGEHKVIASKNEEEITSINEAIKEAIIFRG